MYGCCLGATGEMRIYSFASFALQACWFHCDIIQSCVIKRSNLILSDSWNMLVRELSLHFCLMFCEVPSY